MFGRCYNCKRLLLLPIVRGMRLYNCSFKNESGHDSSTCVERLNTQVVCSDCKRKGYVK